MALERRRRVTAVELGQPVRRQEPLVQRKAAAFARWHEPYKSRGLRTDVATSKDWCVQQETDLPGQESEALLFGWQDGGASKIPKS